MAAQLILGPNSKPCTTYATANYLLPPNTTYNYDVMTTNSPMNSASNCTVIPLEDQTVKHDPNPYANAEEYGEQILREHTPQQHMEDQWSIPPNIVQCTNCDTESIANVQTDYSLGDDVHFSLENGYRILEKAGDTLQGELFKGEVLKETDIVTRGTYVAIKRTHKTLFEQKMVFEDEDGMNEFVEEDIVKEAMILNHLTVNNQAIMDHIVQFVDFYESESHFYLVTQWVDGMNLREFSQKAHELIRDGKLSTKDWSKTCKFIMWQLVATTRWLHDVYHCCHLDLVLENVMIENADFMEGEDGKVSVGSQISVKVVDFGVAEIFGPRGEKGIVSFDCMKSGLTVDNAPYVAPKVFDHDIYDARMADIWSLGQMFYGMMSGDTLWEAEDLWDEPQNGYLALKSGKLKQWMKMNNLSRFFRGNAFPLLDSMMMFEEEKRVPASRLMKMSWFKSYSERYGQKIDENMQRDIQLLQQQTELMDTFPFYSEI